MKKSPFILFYCLAMTASLWGGAAGAREYALTPQNARIGFYLDGNIHATHGSALQFRGRVRIPEDRDPRGYFAEVTVPVMGLDTANALRDKKMRLTCLEAKPYPEIHFQSTRFQGFPTHLQKKKDFDFTLTGDLTIRTITRRVAIPVRVRPGDRGLHLSGSVWLDYIKDFHIKDPSVFIFRVAKKVEVFVDLDLPYSLFEIPEDSAS